MKKPIWIFGRIFIGWQFERPRRWKSGALNLKEWEEWDRDRRQALGWRAGLEFWKKTNTPGSRVLISRHWPHRLCWDWSVWVGRYRGELYDGKRKLIVNFSLKYRSIQVSLFGPYLHIHWQDSSYMAGLGERKAPEILWAHHLEHMEAAGRA